MHLMDSLELTILARAFEKNPVKIDVYRPLVHRGPVA